MEQLSSVWAALPGWFLSATSRAAEAPYPALHVMGGVILLALLARSLAAITVAIILAGVAAAVLLAHPADQRSWAIFWAVCAASVIATIVAFLRHRLARRVSILKAQLADARDELADLRPKYEREVVWRTAAQNQAPAQPLRNPSGEASGEPANAGGRFARSWRAVPQQDVLG